MAPITKIGSDIENTGKILAEFISDKIQKHQESNPNIHFVMGLSGGSMPKILSKVIGDMKVDWRKVKFIFCDERLVTFENDDSTFKAYKEAFISKVDDINEDNFVIINPDLPVEKAAEDYTEKLLALEGDQVAL